MASGVSHVCCDNTLSPSAKSALLSISGSISLSRPAIAFLTPFPPLHHGKEGDESCSPGGPQEGHEGDESHEGKEGIEVDAKDFINR